MSVGPGSSKFWIDFERISKHVAIVPICDVASFAYATRRQQGRPRGKHVPAIVAEVPFPKLNRLHFRGRIMLADVRECPFRAAEDVFQRKDKAVFVNLIVPRQNHYPVLRQQIGTAAEGSLKNVVGTDIEHRKMIHLRTIARGTGKPHRW